MAKPVALIVDDEPDILELLALTLARMDVEAVSAVDLAQAKHEAGRRSFDLCLTDMKLPDGDGLSFVEWLHEHQPDAPVAVITAHGNVEAAVEALKRGAFDFVSKPVQLDTLRKLVNQALKLVREPPGETPPDQAATPLKGRSDAIRRVHDMAGRVARSQAPVLITGESGTGKELVARMIHDRGPRADRPFVPVNCGAIPSELMESELFGHRKGAFTGATADKPGLFQTAEGGTLFLDEIGDLPLHMQVKLLRVIQEKAVRPVGGGREEPVDVRIVSATHRDLGAMVQSGDFREDLYYRVNVIDIHVPPLRDRPEDIPDLAQHILARLGHDHDAPDPSLTEEAERKLAHHDYPGNVRELENVLERALALTGDRDITGEDIHLRPGAEPREALQGASSLPPADQPLPEYLEDVERAAIENALERTGHNKTRAAELLGMSFRSLRYRIKKLGIE